MGILQTDYTMIPDRLHEVGDAYSDRMHEIR